MALGIKTVLRSLRVMGEQGRPLVPLGVKSHQPDSVFRAVKQGRAHSARDVTARRASPSLPSINIFGPIRRVLRAWLLGVLLLLGGSVHAQETENQPPVAEYQLYPEWLRMDVSEEVSVGYAFKDPDDDPLTYAAIFKSGEAVVTVSVAESTDTVTLTPVAVGGPATIEVTATDTDGLSVTQELTVTVTRNYDTDSDGLIEITTLAQLDAIRHDLDGDGNPAYGTDTAYAEAFPQGGVTERGRLACGRSCKGYELTADLDFFDTNGDGQVDTNDDTNGDGQVDAEDNTTYWNEGAGWMPIDAENTAFTATFDGNAHTIRNLFVRREDAFATGLSVGLFGQIDSPGVLRNVGLIDVDVTGGKLTVGGLVGSIDRGGSITASYVTGRVVGMHNVVGGLAGTSGGSITASYFAGHVEGEGSAIGGLAGTSSGSITKSYATGQVVASSHVGGLVGTSSGSITKSYATACVVGISNDAGGLVGENKGTITASYATGSVAGRIDAGGLVGSNVNERGEGTITASYATGHVIGNTWVGGLVGRNVRKDAEDNITEGTITASYWDTDTSGMAVGVGTDDADNNGIIDGTESQTAGVAGQTTAQLQEPTDYTGIYETWDDNDDLWDFGEDDEYPVLLVDFDGDETATWKEFGYQFREGIVLTATMPLEGVARVDLAWTGVTVDHWDPEPVVTYVLLRDDGTTVETLSENTAAGDYSDLSVTPGSTYTYRVAVVVMGGEATCTGVSVSIPEDANRYPQVAEELEDQTLLMGTDKDVPVAGAFQDPDEDELTYEATSSNTGVVTVSVTGSTVTLTSVAVGGPATITVTATDTDGLSATQEFMVTVTNPPPPPPPPDTNTPTNTDPEPEPEPEPQTPNNPSGPVGTVGRTVSRPSAQPSPVGFFENPERVSFQSGIGVISGWVCEAGEVEIEIRTESGDTKRYVAGYGTERLDTEKKCGDTNNGFGLLFNWNRLGNGRHRVVARVDGVMLGRATVRVTMPDEDEEMLRDVQGRCEAADFPSPGETATLIWQESLQNFVIADGEAPSGTNRAGSIDIGFLENPGPNSFQSGIGVISGWVCEAGEVLIEFNGEAQPAAYGTERLDTQDYCGDTDNGFGLLFNWNRLEDGEHTVVALVDGEELGRATIQVTTLGEDFVRDADGECEAVGFPSPEEMVTLTWQEPLQNFVITAIE